MRCLLMLPVLLLCSCAQYNNREIVPREPIEVGVKSKPVDLTLADIERLNKDRSFQSKEGLLQLFYDLRHSGRHPAVRLNRELITALRSRIRTAFPLKECDEIVFADSLLMFRFDKPQVVGVPGTFGQVSLSLSKRVLFFVEPEKKAGTIVFQTREGGLRANIGGLFRLQCPWAPDIQVQQLVYTIDYEKKNSSILLIENIHVPRKQIDLTRCKKDGIDRIVLDLRHASCTRKQDVIVEPNRLIVLGLRHTIRTGKKEDAFMRRIVEALRSDAEKALKDGVRLGGSASYNLELRKFNMSKWWSFPGVSMKETDTKPGRD